jgi:putative nucleotidyltransferase with HDIG domain
VSIDRGALRSLQVEDPSVTHSREAAKLASILTDRSDELIREWLDQAGQVPELDQYVRGFIAGLEDVFSGRGWTFAQTVIDGLAEQRARRGLRLELRVQRALLAGRRAIRPFLDEVDDPVVHHEIFFDALQECLFRFTESFQGLHLQSESERLHLRIIKSLVMALEARDAYTKGHSISVALLAQKIALQMGSLDPDRVYLAGILHDVGKVGVPDEILNKEGELTDEEWAAMQRHPEIGANILRPINLYPEVIDGAFTHHENYDGSGYPNGIMGEEVPLIGRILRVADAFDAMTSTRVYRPARTTTFALEIVDDGAGVAFDPNVVAAFNKVIASPEAVQDLGMASLLIDMRDFTL